MNGTYLCKNLGVKEGEGVYLKGYISENYSNIWPQYNKISKTINTPLSFNSLK